MSNYIFATNEEKDLDIIENDDADDDYTTEDEDRERDFERNNTDY